MDNEDPVIEKKEEEDMENTWNMRGGKILKHIDDRSIPEIVIEEEDKWPEEGDAMKEIKQFYQEKEQSISMSRPASPKIIEETGKQSPIRIRRLNL